jgi:hypothetical protein
LQQNHRYRQSCQGGDCDLYVHAFCRLDGFVEERTATRGRGSTIGKNAGASGDRSSCAKGG